MPNVASCVCGHQIQINSDSHTFPLNCPVCGQTIDPCRDQKDPLSWAEDKRARSPADADAVANESVEAPMLLQLLLDPTTIQRLLLFGGGLSVLGLIAWLVSVGLFDDPRILATGLGMGTLALLSSGWGVVLRTRYRLAGQALTFLACVVAPLNLWFYDVQGLLTVEGHLWVGGLACTALYVMTVWKLRDPLFLYAVEAGVTMTVLLCLGDFHRATDSSALCLAMVVLSAISIHAEAAFDRNHPTFSRCKFGLPLFFSGQVQLAVGTISLLVLQIFNWVLKPAAGEWSHSRVANSPWLTGSIWLVAAWLWVYSDLAVRQLSAYTALAAVALILAEVSLLYPILPLEVLIIALSVTAVVVRWSNNRIGHSDSRWSSIGNTAVVMVSEFAFLLGIIQHVQQTNLVEFNGTHDDQLQMAALICVAANLCFQGFQTFFHFKQSNYLTLACWTSAGFSFWLGLMHGLEIIGIHAMVEQTSLLMLLPLTIALLAPRFLRRNFADSAVIAARVMAIMGLMAPLASVVTVHEWSDFFVSQTRDRSSLFAGLVDLELATLCFANRSTKRSGWITLGCGILCSLAGSWNLLIFVDLPETIYSPLLAGSGIALALIGQLRSKTKQVVDQIPGDFRAQEIKSSSSTTADLMLVAGELIAFFQTLPWLSGPLEPISFPSLIAVLLSTVFSALAAVIVSSRSMRGWHRFAASIIAASLTLAWIRSQQLADYQKLELVLEVLGLAWMGIGFVGRLNETDRRRDAWVSLSLWAGSVTATLPVLFCTLMHRWSPAGPSLGDELGLITMTSLMVAVGCVLQIRSTTTCGGLTLVVYLAVLFGHLAYHPQIAVGVYLVVGGAAIFLTGLALSIFRDRLLALPSKINNREGIFRVIDWR